MAMWCERLVLLVVSLLLAGSCAGQWAVVKGYRVVMKADIVRDFPGMCYDVSSCSARAINESWAIGACSRAACEMDESGILLEVHYTCPRLQNRPTLLCDIIEDKRLPFPACCPRMICQRHKKPPPPTQTQLKPFTPHVSVDKELRKIPFVLKRFLEVQNTTLLDAIILNRIKALEAAANASAAANGTAGADAGFHGPTSTDDLVEVVMLTTQGPGVTTQDTTPFGTTDGTVTTSSPAQRTPTEPAVEIIRGPGFQSDSLQQEPLRNLTVPPIEDDEEFFLNDSPVVPSSGTETTTSVPETPKTTTSSRKGTLEDVTEQIRTSSLASDRTNKPTVTTVTTEPSSEATTEIYDETTTRSLGLTVPESIFGTTPAPSTELSRQTAPTTPATTEKVEEVTAKNGQSESGKKSGNLPTILRSLVDNVFDYYDYIDYYVPGQKRNLTSLGQDRASDRRRIPESMMELVKEQLTKQKDRNDSSVFVEDLQADQPTPKDDPETTTPDPDNQEFTKELVTKMAMDIPRVTKQEPQDTTTAFARTETATQEATRVEFTSTTVAPTTATSTVATTERTLGTTVAEGSTETATQATATDTTLTLVKSVGSQSRAKVNLAIENLSAEKPEDRTTTGVPISTVTTSTVPQSTLTPTTPSRTTTSPTTVSSPPSTQETTAAVTATRTTGPPETSRQPDTTQAVTRSFQTAGETESVFVGTTNTNVPGTTSSGTTTSSPGETPSSAAPSTTTVQQTTTTKNAETTRPVTLTETVGTTATGTRLPTTVTTAGSAVSTDATITNPQTQTTLQTLPVESAKSTVPLLTSTEPATTSVTTSPTTPVPTSAGPSQQPLGDAPSSSQANLQKDDSLPQAQGNATTKGQPTPPTSNNDVEYIDYVYYYDYVDTPDNSTANGTATSSRNNTGTRQTQLLKKVA